jgi:hypothetical protein
MHPELLQMIEAKAEAMRLISIGYLWFSASAVVMAIILFLISFAYYRKQKDADHISVMAVYFTGALVGVVMFVSGQNLLDYFTAHARAVDTMLDHQAITHFLPKK